MQGVWKTWKRLPGVLSDRKNNVKIKWNMCRTVVRPSLVYLAETLVLMTVHEKVEVTEMRKSCEELQRLKG